MGKVAKKAKPGRPAAYDKPRTQIAARLQAPLHERIKSDADAAGRSISEEIERRLERSFEFENQLVDLGSRGGPGISAGDQLRELIATSGRPVLDICLERIQQSFLFENRLNQAHEARERREALLDEALTKLRATERELALLKAGQSDEIPASMLSAIEQAVARGIKRAGE